MYGMAILSGALESVPWEGRWRYGARGMRGEWRRLRLKSCGGFWFFSPWPLFRGGEKAGDDNLLFSSVSPDCGGGGGMDAALTSRKYIHQFFFQKLPFLENLSVFLVFRFGKALRLSTCWQFSSHIPTVSLPELISWPPPPP